MITIVKLQELFTERFQSANNPESVLSKDSSESDPNSSKDTVRDGATQTILDIKKKLVHLKKQLR